MSTEAMKNLEAKAKISRREWSQDQLEHARTISGSEVRDDAQKSTFVSICYYDIANGVEEAPGRVVLTQVS
jgi:hypothetical protein